MAAVVALVTVLKRAGYILIMIGQMLCRTHEFHWLVKRSIFPVHRSKCPNACIDQ